jgi:hypoxanthine phosphoribosyltransferase
MAIHYLTPNWNTYHSLAQKLAATILDNGSRADEIVAISRGGLTLGHLMSDFLQIPISTITIQSYTDIQKQGEITISAKLQNSIKNKHILLVDDVSDTGKTLLRAIKYLKRAGAKKVTTVTLYYKPHSVYRPDYFAKETDRWIIFPHDATEMSLLISKNMEKDGKSKAQIQTFLERLGFTISQIAFVRRHYLNNAH